VVVASSLCLEKERLAARRLHMPVLRSLYEQFAGLEELEPEARATIVELLLREACQGTSPIDGWSLDGFLASGTAAHIANDFGLCAVPLAVEAACASSLAAVDVAVQGLRAGDFDYAVVGGVELPCNARDLVLCSALRLLSRGKMMPLSADADGFTVGDGLALFLLKRASDARRAGDSVLALIRSVGGSSDARSLVAPDVHGQARAIDDAFGQVEFSPSDVQFLELHGTGTLLGDQVEALALALTYGSARREAPLILGAVKSMVGHTFAAAGAAGLLQSVLALRHKSFPPHADFASPSRRLSLDSIPARAFRAVLPWPPGAGPRRAGVSAFGTGGINYHLLLEEPEERKGESSHGL
jgi:acyl transferase domain-containing protein